MRRKTFRPAMAAASNNAFRSAFVKNDGTYQTRGHNNIHSSVNTKTFTQEKLQKYLTSIKV
jgi:hypothetical protein